MTASGEAETAAMAAMAAVANLATMQTNATAGGLAYEAHTAAGKAMMAYMDAKAASGDAAEAEDVTAAVTARLAAEEASANAVKYAMTATEKAGEAETAAMAELMIVGKTKSVGDMSITVDTAKSSVTTTVDSSMPTTVVTGEVGKITAMSDPVDSVGYVPASMPEDPVVVEVIGKPSIPEQTINIGVKLDSEQDSARLNLVTHFIGTGTVGAYNQATDAMEPEILQKDHNAFDHDGDSDDGSDVSDTPAVMIKMASSTFYNADAAIDVDADASGVNKGQTAIASNAKGTNLYYYDVPGLTESDPAVRQWLKRTSTDTGEGTGVVTHIYAEVTAVDGLEKFPMKTAYKHLHYGTWNQLDAKGNAIDDLGIGFVTATSDGMGMTGDDMPNVGMANYNGHWVASVREADMEGDGKISEQTGRSMMTAKFETNGIMVDLMGLANLDGTITGDRFKGTKVTGVMAGDGRLDASGTFTGSFSGAFFGPKAAEAGGVFDYTSKDMKAGEFSGAFGGDKE